MNDNLMIMHIQVGLKFTFTMHLHGTLRLLTYATIWQKTSEQVSKRAIEHGEGH